MDFAKVSQEVKEQWSRFIEEYLSQRSSKRVIHVIDVRHPPTNDDCLMFEWLDHYQIPTLIVATKADKISRGNWQKHLKEIKRK